MAESLTTTKALNGRKVRGKAGKSIGKVRHFVFYPTEKRLIGFTVKRPDAMLMFHRKDLFVPLGGYHLEDGVVVAHDESATGKSVCKALGVEWDACVLWVGMPVITVGGEALGYVSAVSFDGETGAVDSITAEDGAANNAILGKREIPARLVKGFRLGKGEAIAPVGSLSEEGEDDQVVRGAIAVADEAADIEPSGGAAEAAGKATAVAADKVKKGAAKAKVDAERAKAVVDEKVEQAKPTARRVAKKTGEAVNKGAYAAGEKLGKASGMFAAFKEEFDKGMKGSDE